MRALLALLLLAGSLQARSPNVVLLLADDLGWSDVGFNGRKDWRTPHVDKLASQGTNFSRWYVSSVVCAPSRAAMMTGKVGIHNGVSGNNDDLPADQVTVADALKKRGYKTAMFGKWHHGRVRPGSTTYRHPLDLGFDEFVGFVDARAAWEHFPKKLYHGRDEKPVKGGYAPTIFADHAIDFMTRNRETPFFLYVPFIEPHLHIEAPEEDVKEYRGKFAEADPKTPFNATYAAMITRMDKEIGRILGAIDKLGLADDTLVIFTSDHGATFEVGNKGASAFHDSNRPFRGQKRSLYEGGIRVPACVRYPGKVPAGKTSAEIVHMTDLFPTFLAAAGGKPDAAAKLDGVNLWDVWQGKAKSPERTLFWEWRMEGHQQAAAMRGDMKLVRIGTQPVELYDLRTDPGERRNRAAEFPKLVPELRKELEAWLLTETEESKWGKKAGK